MSENSTLLMIDFRLLKRRSVTLSGVATTTEDFVCIVAPAEDRRVKMSAPMEWEEALEADEDYTHILVPAGTALVPRATFTNSRGVVRKATTGRSRNGRNSAFMHASDEDIEVITEADAQAFKASEREGR